jgi:glycosyltransferase involved in cell wall biosynthesis
LSKIFINGKFFTQPVTGTQRYAREVLKAIDALQSEGEYQNLSFEVLIPKTVKSAPQFANVHVRSVGKLQGTGWEQLDLPRYCGGHVLVTLSGGAPILHSRNVVAIHDAAIFSAPDGYSTAYRLWYRSLYRKLTREAEHILTNSHFSKREIATWCRADPEKISVTYLGSEHITEVSEDLHALASLGITGAYVLTVSSHNPNKNFIRVGQALKSFRDKGIDVVVAGGEDSRVYRSGMKLPDHVRVLGYVTDAQLKALYANAACFVFASLYEGFGLPPLEAMSLGCPIVVSRAAALPEIFKDVAIFCDPYSSDDIAHAVDQALRTPLASRAERKAFAQKYSWRQCARETLRIIEGLRQGSAPSGGRHGTIRRGGATQV